MSQVAKEFHFDGPQRDEMLGGTADHANERILRTM